MRYDAKGHPLGDEGGEVLWSCSCGWLNGANLRCIGCNAPAPRARAYDDEFDDGWGYDLEYGPGDEDFAP